MTPNHLIRLTQAAMLAAVVAVFVPNLAQAKPAPDWIERFAIEHPYGAGIVSSQPSNWFTRNDQAHFGRSDAAVQASVVVDGRSPDTLDAAQTVQATVLDGRSPDTLDAAQSAQGGQLQVLDGRSPDTRDAAQTSQPIELTSSSGFDWSDAGIGAASGAGLFLLLGMSMLLLLRTHRRHDVQAT